MTNSSAPQRGSATVFGLGLVIMIFLVGGLSIDLWRVIAERQDLVQKADAAAAAGANQIDIAEYRLNGILVLDDAAASHAAQQILGQPTTWDFAVVNGGVEARDGDGLANDMVVELSREVEFALLGILSSTKSVTITVESVASPQSTG